MQTRTALSSLAVGRRPADNPKAVVISFRVNGDVADALDEEIERRRSPGLELSRSDMARMLMAERLDELRTAKKSAKK